MPSFVAAECFAKSWIDRQRSVLGGGDPTLIEKAIRALALVAELAGRQVPFVFKGGSSLLLRVPVIRRVSIDVDIVCTLPDAELDKILRGISRVPPFVGCEEDLRDAARLREQVYESLKTGRTYELDPNKKFTPKPTAVPAETVATEHGLA